MRHIISQTPLRMSLFGGGTDYPAYYQKKPGAVLGFTINQHIYISINTVGRFVDHRIRLSYSKIEEISSIEEISHPSVKACLKHKNIDLPLDIHIGSDLPAKTGLGSSSAFTVGFLNALYALENRRVSKERLAEEACFIEQELIGERVGSQDQFHAAFGGINIFEFGPTKTVARPLILSSEKRHLLDKHLLVFYTGITRFAHEIVKEQLENTEKKTSDRALEKMYEAVFEAEEIFSCAKKEELPFLLGRLLHKNWILKKELSSQISNPKIDAWIEKALASGAFGAKLCGAGGGGFLLFLVPEERKEAVRYALHELIEVPIAIDSVGSTILFMKE